MTVSSAAPLSRIVSAKSRCVSSSGVSSSRSVHADHAVHGCADLMTHVCQECALRAARSFSCNSGAMERCLVLSNRTILCVSA